jgi:hypothetical protein
VNRSDILRTSQFFYDFLTEKDEKVFEKQVKKLGASLVQVKLLKEFSLKDGKADVSISQEAVVFC